MRNWLRIYSAALGVFAVVAPPSSAQQMTAIRAGKLLDPESAAISANQIILVEGDKIKAVGAGLAIPKEATLIDLSGSTVLPGLFDCHTHLCTPPLKLDRAVTNFPVPVRWEAGGLAAFYLTTLLNPTGYRAIHGVAAARDMLEAGFTTVRDLGHAGNYADTDLRRAVEEGLVAGPTIINAGKKIAPFGGQFTLQPETGESVNPDYFHADTRDEMRKAIRQNIHYGARVIKLAIDSEPYSYSADDVRFIVEDAARSGLRVSVDLFRPDTARRAIEGGVASIEHGTRMGKEELELAKKRNVALVPTAQPRSLFDGLGASESIVKTVIESQGELLRRAHQSGVMLAFGTDVVYTRPGHTRGTLALDTLDAYAEAGLPPKIILQMMTSNAARLLGVEKERGALGPGMAADLVATPENPLDNIHALKKVSFVMKGGKIVVRR